MAELVFRPRRAVWVFSITLFGYFFVGSLAIAFPVQLGPVLDVFGIEKDGLAKVQFIGLLLAAAFGFFVVLCAVRLMSPVLRVTGDGIEIGKRKLAWSEVEDFRPESSRWGVTVTRVRVLYAPGHQLNRSERRSVALGKLGLYFPPTYIGVIYDTGRQPLAEILRYWLAGYRDG
ncbi:MAG: hypothetical protein QOD39_2877 [Mycobacterium sp.]|nr:hypothetical protein [Mycobacterium sp.]